MSELISNPPADFHIAPCGLFCTECGKFKSARCKGCQVVEGLKNCPVRICVIEKEITTCAECEEFTAPRDFRECGKLNSIISRIFSLIFRSNRPEALTVLRDQGNEAYLSKYRKRK